MRLTLLDLSPAMLARTADIPGEKRVGSVMDLPFADGSFDVVVSNWVIETVLDPMRVISEYLRVITDAGVVLYTFCSLPGGFISRAGTSPLRAAVENRFAGRFLSLEETPWHECGYSRRVQSDTILTTFVQLRRCCTVGRPILPAAATIRDPVDTPHRYSSCDNGGMSMNVARPVTPLRRRGAESALLLFLALTLHQLVMLSPMHEHVMPMVFPTGENASAVHVDTTTPAHEQPVIAECPATVAVFFSLVSLLTLLLYLVLPPHTVRRLAAVRLPVAHWLWPPDRRRALLQVFLC